MADRGDRMKERNVSAEWPRVEDTLQEGVGPLEQVLRDVASGEWQQVLRDVASGEWQQAAIWFKAEGDRLLVGSVRVFLEESADG